MREKLQAEVNQEENGTEPQGTADHEAGRASEEQRGRQGLSIEFSRNL
jgi:hypothetical protein